jgi:hypothetical protein
MTTRTTPRFRADRLVRIGLALALMSASVAQVAPPPPREALAPIPPTLVRAFKGGVEWLLAAQSDDGHWSAAEYGGGAQCDVGVTALAVLALLESGRPESGVGVERGLAWLVARQRTVAPHVGLVVGDPVGHTFLYDHAIATLALWEARRAGVTAATAGACEAATRIVLEARNADGVWRYDLPPIGDNDTSVTGWMVEALRSAERAGMPAEKAAYVAAIKWFDEVTELGTGRCGYDALGTLSSRVEGRNDHYPMECGEALTATCMLARLCIGEWAWKPETMKMQAELLVKCLPQTPKGKGAVGNDMYYWLRGAAAMRAYRRLDERVAEKWLDAVRSVLTKCQVQQQGNTRGSWDPVGPWGWAGGRVYSTSIALLTLRNVIESDAR